MNLQEWIAQLPKGWQDEDIDDCVKCGEDEVWDFNICITCAEEMNADEW